MRDKLGRFMKGNPKPMGAGSFQKGNIYSNNRKGHKMSQTQKEKIGLGNKGKIRSEEARKKVSLAKKDKKLSEEHIKNISKGHIGLTWKVKDTSKLKHPMKEETKKKLSLLNKGKGNLKNLGENNGMWKGGITPLNRLLRRSSMYKIWRESIFLRDNFTCQNSNCEYCGNKQGIYLHAHHVKSFSQYPKLRFKIDNGITYCEEFHINSKLLHKGIKIKI